MSRIAKYHIFSLSMGYWLAFQTVASCIEAGLELIDIQLFTKVFLQLHPQCVKRKYSMKAVCVLRKDSEVNLNIVIRLYSSYFS